MKPEMTKSFEKWDIDDVERTFMLQPAPSGLLEAWLQATYTPNDHEASFLTMLAEEIDDYADLWNEDEMKFRFIAPLISLIRYHSGKVRPFTQRTITATVNGVRLTGRVDFMIATGKSKPIQPFFFLHEYKKERGSDNDPRAQLLVEMLAARELNTAIYPLYGCYVVGRYWYFLVLEGSTYSESAPYLVSGSGIFTIFSILREAKTIITRLAEQYIS